MRKSREELWNLVKIKIWYLLKRRKKKKFSKRSCLEIVLKVVWKVVFVLYLSLRELRARLRSEMFLDIMKF